MNIRKISNRDREWICEILGESWGSSVVIARSVIHQADKLPGLIAEIDGQKVGLLTYTIEPEVLEIITINVLRKREGVGRALMEEVLRIAKSKGCSQVRVVTTNDNTPAIQFYQAIQFEIVEVRKGAVENSRKLKPSIPLTGFEGIPITDEIELERSITSDVLDNNTYL